MGTSTTPSSSKVCVFCGMDVSSKPRVKDAKGHYACPECAEKAKAKQVAAPAAAVVKVPEPERSVMDELLDGAVQVSGKACPECGTYQKPGAVLCANCGYNANTGKHVKTQVLRAAKEKRAPTSKEYSDGGISPLALWAVATLVLTAIAASAFVSPSFFTIAIVLLMIYATGVSIMVIADAFRTSPLSGAIMIAGLVVPFVGLYTIYYVIFKCSDGRLKALYFAIYSAIVGFVVVGVLAGIKAGNAWNP